MKKIWLLIASAILIHSPCNAAIRSPFKAWVIGHEREVDEGVYFKLLMVKSGWRLWKIETSSSIECRAIKSAKGQPHPVPIGAGAMFGLGEPFFEVWSYDNKIRYNWHGETFKNSNVQVRHVGEKFWSKHQNTTDYTEGALVEVNVIGWEYPAVKAGYHESFGVIDMTGLDEMKQIISECETSPPA